MRRALLACAWTTCVLASSQAQDFGKVTNVALPESLRCRSARLVDWTGDGAKDLVVVASDRGDGDDATPKVELRLHRRQAAAQEAAFSYEPDHVWQATPDVVAYAVADVHADAGSEVLLFNARGVFAWRPLAQEERERVVLLWRGDVLWQTPSRRSIREWAEGLADLDGDGLVDLVLPYARGYHVLRQVQDDGGRRFEEVTDCRLPEPEGIWNSAPSLQGRRPDLGLTSRAAGRDDSSGRRDSGRGLSFGPPEEGGGVLIDVAESAPAPFLRDWDADGDLDLVAQDDDELLIWVQAAGASFASDPEVRLELPVSGRDEERGFDFSYASFADDLDGDGRMDNVVLAGDKRSDSARTQVLVFHQAQRALFGEDGTPVQVLVLAGLGGFPRLVDVDGDNLRDLFVFSFRPDLLDGIRSATSRKVEIEAFVFRNEGGRFDKRPVLSTSLAVPIEGGDFRARFPGDATGDGLSELLVRDASDHLSLHYVRRLKSTWKLEERPLWERTIDEDADLVIEDARPGVPLEFLVVERGQVLHVSFP